MSGQYLVCLAGQPPKTFVLGWPATGSVCAWLASQKVRHRYLYYTHMHTFVSLTVFMSSYKLSRAQSRDTDKKWDTFGDFVVLV